MITWLETGSSQTCPACRNSHARTAFGVDSGAPAAVFNSLNITVMVADFDDTARFYGDFDDDYDSDASDFYPDPFDDTDWTSPSSELD